ncbi:MAG: glycoside hydrolase family 27 protein, partial [Oscillospiraceae bacterium]|nr:glycoside hydrolase family 27 protein [Oscillospiraceae bacterium]
MLAKTPPMGWNSWNTFGENIHADLIKETADAFVANGLKEAGYEYLVIDDCWSEYDRDPVTDKIVPHKEKFPNGMNDVSDYVHSKGLKFGMYSCAGVRTCADYPGSFDHEYLDAKTFAEFGADFLKYDFCYKPDSSDGPILYHRMGTALSVCGREILF